MKEVKRSSQIKINIGLDTENIPNHIDWESNDKASEGKLRESKAMLVSFFDKETKETFKIDLWTKEMQVAEMDRFFFQTLKAMADTYFKATQNSQLATDMQRFVQYFGEQTEIIPKPNS
ncbi:MAG: gliding motility protein GldC [Saprospiraceae bacterium]|nr:MAG: gliding motility protein GldC [Saprospiraceae bacterium]